jgi:hypothetical protein
MWEFPDDRIVAVVSGLTCKDGVGIFNVYVFEN